MFCILLALFKHVKIINWLVVQMILYGDMMDVNIYSSRAKSSNGTMTKQGGSSSQSKLIHWQCLEETWCSVEPWHHVLRQLSSCCHVAYKYDTLYTEYIILIYIEYFVENALCAVHTLRQQCVVRPLTVGEQN